MREGSRLSGGQEGVVRAAWRRDTLLRTLADSSLALLSDQEIDEILPSLLRNLLESGNEAVAYLALQRADGDHPRWRVHQLQTNIVGVDGPRHELAKSIQDSVAKADFRVFLQNGAPTVRVCKSDGRVVLAPVFHGSVLCGLLWMRASAAEAPWAVEELEALERVGQCLGRAIENRANWRALRGRLAQQEALIEAGLTVSSSLNLSTVLDRLAEQMAQAVDATSAYLSDWDAETGEATVLAEFYSREATRRERISALGMTFHLMDEFQLGNGALDQGQVVIYQASDSRLADAVRTQMRTIDGRTILAVPFVVEGRTVGFAALCESRMERAFDAAEIEICKGMARQGAIAFENARLYEQVRQRVNELELVHQVAIATARLVDIDQLLQETTKFIAERIYPDVFGFVLRDDGAGTFMPHASYHGLPKYGLEMAVPIENSVTGYVVRTGQPLIIDDVSKEPMYFSIVDETRSEIAVPMLSEGKVIGVINVESRKRNAFSQADLRFLVTLAGQVTTAIERARLYEDLERHAEQLADEVDRRTLELKWERDRMLAILDSAGEGILFTDVEAKILYVNPALEWQTGYTRSECLGARPSLWRSPETDDAVFSEMWTTLLSGKRWRGELSNRRKDGTRFDAALTITPLNDVEGKLSGFVGVQADISRLKEVDRLKSKFIANVSHELRTPLTNIRNYTFLLERGNEERRHKYLGVIKQESERLTRLIQDLLDLSRLEENGRPLDLQPINVGTFVRETTTTFAAQAERRQIALDCCVHEPLPPVMASRLELQQVLGNLLGNALAYTPVGGRVQVSTGAEAKDEHPMVWIRVEDNGPGIATTEIPRLFERFYRGEAARRSGAPGTGLGLAISKEILNNYGGKLVLDSVPGEGALFTIWFPGQDPCNVRNE